MGRMNKEKAIRSYIIIKNNEAVVEVYRDCSIVVNTYIKYINKLVGWFMKPHWWF